MLFIHFFHHPIRSEACKTVVSGLDNEKMGHLPIRQYASIGEQKSRCILVRRLCILGVDSITLR